MSTMRAAAMLWHRRRRIGAPEITTAPVLTWSGAVGTSPVIDAPVYDGEPGTVTYTLLRDGVAVGGVEAVSEAVLEAYVAVLADEDALALVVVARVVNTHGSDTSPSNTVV